MHNAKWKKLVENVTDCQFDNMIPGKDKTKETGKNQ